MLVMGRFWRGCKQRGGEAHWKSLYLPRKLSPPEREEEWGHHRRWRHTV